MSSHFSAMATENVAYSNLLVNSTMKNSMWDKKLKWYYFLIVRVTLGRVTSYVNKPNLPLPPLAAMRSRDVNKTSETAWRRAKPKFNVLLFWNPTLPSLSPGGYLMTTMVQIAWRRAKPKFNILLFWNLILPSLPPGSYWWQQCHR